MLNKYTIPDSITAALHPSFRVVIVVFIAYHYPVNSGIYVLVSVTYKVDAVVGMFAKRGNISFRPER
jgi:hypothetical protein